MDFMANPQKKVRVLSRTAPTLVSSKADQWVHLCVVKTFSDETTGRAGQLLWERTLCATGGDPASRA
jgi:hypothetical protein